MTFNYHLSESDFLDYLFYSTSRSRKVQKRRALNKLILMIIYVVMGLFLFNRNGPIASAVFFVLCIPLYFFYNAFEKKQYNRHFTRFIQNHFQSLVNKPSTITFDDDTVRVIDDEDITYPVTDIEEIHETGSLIMLQMKSGTAVLIPKAQITDLSSLTSKVELLEARGIPLYRNVTWKWK
jgi:hypothetical protein